MLTSITHIKTGSVVIARDAKALHTPMKKYGQLIAKDGSIIMVLKNEDAQKTGKNIHSSTIINSMLIMILQNITKIL